PLLAAAILGVLGRPLRRLLAHVFSRRELETYWNFLFPLAAILLGMIALTVIYRVARPAESRLRDVLPGAVVATLFWWLTIVLYGTYVRKMPYGVVYGGFGAGFGLMVWLEVVAVIGFLCTSWYAERSK